MHQEVIWRVRKNFLHFRKWNFFTSCCKNSSFVFRRRRKGFWFLLVFVSSDVFIIDSTIIIIICSLHSFFFVCQVLCFCVVTASATDMQERFLISGVFYLTPLLTFDTTFFHQGFIGVGSSALNVAGLPTEVQITDLAHLFVWMTQCLANVITWWVLLIC